MGMGVDHFNDSCHTTTEIHQLPTVNSRTDQQSQTSIAENPPRSGQAANHNSATTHLHADPRFHRIRLPLITRRRLYFWHARITQSCEIFYSASKPPASDEALTEQSICWLIDAGIINSLTDIIQTQIIDLPHGYPINTHKKTDSIQTIKAFLRTHNIYSIGRFGAWDYANSDECMRQGLELARKLNNRFNAKLKIKARLLISYISERSQD